MCGSWMCQEYTWNTFCIGVLGYGNCIAPNNALYTVAVGILNWVMLQVEGKTTCNACVVARLVIT